MMLQNRTAQSFALTAPSDGCYSGLLLIFTAVAVSISTAGNWEHYQPGVRKPGYMASYFNLLLVSWS